MLSLRKILYNIPFQLSGTKALSVASRSSKTGLLQSCFMLQCNVPQREKSTLFPKTQKDKKTPYDFEAEFGKRPKKVFPERVESPSSYAKMPFSQPLIIDTVGKSF